jgi:WhiB family redox-sensing transcriptional regulator
MNIDELAQAARAALDEEYAGYDTAFGRARLEDDAIGEAVTIDASGSTRNSADAATPPRRSSGWVTDWSVRAACRIGDADELFTQGAAQNRAKTVCRACPVWTECLGDALDNRVEFGVWGGMTERERRALLRRRPTVTSWRRLLETARREYVLGAGNLPFEDEDLTSIFEQAM